MAVNLKDLQRQLKGVVISMYAEKILDMQQFQEVQEAQKTEPGFVPDILTTFLNNTTGSLKEIEKELKNSAMNFAKAHILAHKVKGSSASIGACKVFVASVEFLQACTINNYEGCKRASKKMNAEFKNIEGKLKTIIELELKIKESN